MSDTPNLCFPRRAHLRTSTEFKLVFGEGKRFSGAYFRLHTRLLTDAPQARLGVSVSKRVDKTSVGRNRVRRQARECFRLKRPALLAGDYVLLAKPEAARTDNAALRADLLSLFERAAR